MQLYPWQVFGLRGVNHSGSALRGDFPVLASVFVPRSFPNTAARQFRSLTGFPIPGSVITEQSLHLVSDQVWKHYTRDIGRGQAGHKKAPCKRRQSPRDSSVPVDQWPIIQGRMEGNYLVS